MIDKKTLSAWVGAAAIGAAGLGIGPAHAQQAAETAQAAPAGGLEQIVVTAEKRQENVQTVPIAIEAFNEHQIDALQITNLDALAINAPGLELTRNLGAAQFAIRGIGGFGITPGVESNVATFIDGVYYPSPQSANFTFNNIARTEVDKGPQGVTFGRNAVGGAIVIDTKDPSHTPHVDFNVGYGNYNTLTGNFYGTTGITDHLAADLSIYGEKQWDGWGKDLYSGKDVHISREWSGRTKWVLNADDATKFTFIADYDRSQPNTVAANFVRGNIGLLNYGPSSVGGFYDSYEPHFSSVDNQQYGITFRAEHDFGWAEGVAITGWRRNKEDVNNPTISVPPYNAANPTLGQPTASVATSFGQWDEQNASQEFQLLSPTSSTIKWIGGAYLFEDVALMTPRLVLNSGAANSTAAFNDARQNTQSYAAFGQATAPVTSDTRVTLGYRYTIDVRTIHGNTTTLAGVVTASALNNPGGTFHRWPKSTYKIGLDHDLAENVLGYASYSRGFESGAYNVVSGPAAAPVNPEILDAYEVGVKSDLMGNSLRLNASLFYYQFHNLVVTEYVNSSPLTVNAAAAEYKGADLDVTYVPVKNLTLTAGVDLVDPKYLSFPGAVYFFPGTNGLNWVSQPGNATGHQVAYTEKVEATSSAQYRIPTDDGDYFLVANLAYHGGIQYDSQGLLKQPAYFLLNTSATWTAPSGMWDVKLWAKNLNGAQYPATLSLNNTQAQYQPAPPRTFGINVGVHWDLPTAEAAYVAPPAPAAAVTPPPAAPAPAPEVQRAFQVFFDFDKSDITDAASKVIQAAAANVKAGHVTTINVTGHTDTVGSAAYNQGLSERRAAAVKQQLVSDGVSDGEISTVGVGKTGLLVPTADGVREPQNRRAEIVLQ